MLDFMKIFKMCTSNDSINRVKGEPQMKNRREKIPYC